MTEGPVIPQATDPAAAPVDPAMAAAPPDPAVTMPPPPPDPAVTMPPETVEPAVDPTVAAAAPPAEPVVEELVVEEPLVEEPLVETPPPDGDGDGVAGEYGDGPDEDGNGIPDEIGINPDSMRNLEDAAETVGEEPSDSMEAEDVIGTQEFPTEPIDLGPPEPLDLSGRIDLSSAAVDNLSARQFLEVQDLLKDTANLSEPGALEDLDPGQMQLVIQALAGHVNGPDSDMELPEDFSIEDLLDPEAPGPTLEPSVLEGLDEGQMEEVTQALGGSEGQPDLEAIRDLSPEQVQTVVQAFLGYMGTPGANVVEAPEGEGPQDIDDAVTNLEDAIAGGEEGAVSDAIEDLREFIRDSADGDDGAGAGEGRPVELDDSEGTIGVSRSALTVDDSDDDGGPREVVDVSDAIEDFTEAVFGAANFLDDKAGDSRDFGFHGGDAIDVSKDPDSPFDQDGKEPFDLDLTATESSGPATAAAAGMAGASMVDDVGIGDFQDAAGNISDIGGIIDDPSSAAASTFFDALPFDAARDGLSAGQDVFEVLDDPFVAAEEIIDGGVQDIIAEGAEDLGGSIFGGAILGGPILGGIGAVGGFDVVGDVGEVAEDVIEDIPVVEDVGEAVGDVAEDIGDFFGF